MVFPESITDPIGKLGSTLSVVFDRVHVAPAPGEPFTRAKRHVHGGVFSRIAVAIDRPFEDIDRRFPLVAGAAIGL